MLELIPAFFMDFYLQNANEENSVRDGLSCI